MRIPVGELADLLHRLGVDLALDLGDVDHLATVWLGHSALAAPASRGRRPRPAAADAGQPSPSAPAARRFVGRDDAAHQRAHHDQQHDEAEQAHHHHLDARMMSSLVNCSVDSQPVGSAIGVAGVSAKRRLTTSTWSPRFWSKPMAERTSAAMRSISSLLRG